MAKKDGQEPVKEEVVSATSSVKYRVIWLRDVTINGEQAAAGSEVTQALDDRTMAKLIACRNIGVRI
jgi:hypothetical protein